MGKRKQDYYWLSSSERRFEDQNPHPDKNYDSLRSVLDRAYSQASEGKGSERHAQGQPFTEQPMQELISLYGIGFALGQAAKKAQEAQRLSPEHAVHELLGAIVYLVGAVVYIESQESNNAS